jgi:hypothetical protein
MGIQFSGGGSGDPVDALKGDGTLVAEDLTALLAGANLSWQNNGNESATLNAEPGYTDSDKQALSTHPVAMSELANGDYVDIPMRVPNGKTVYVWKWGCRTDNLTTPNGLTVGLYDNDAAAYILNENTPYNTGAPLASHDGAGDLSLRLENATGGTISAGADFSATIE